jgi:hypothetical protein
LRQCVHDLFFLLFLFVLRVLIKFFIEFLYSLLEICVDDLRTCKRW